MGFTLRGAWAEAAHTWPASGGPSAFHGNDTQYFRVGPPTLSCVWTSRLHLPLSWASVSKVCPKYQESLREVLFGGLGVPLNFPEGLMVTASLLRKSSTGALYFRIVGKAVGQCRFLILSRDFLCPVPLTILAYSKPMIQLLFSVCFLVAADYSF